MELVLKTKAGNCLMIMMRRYKIIMMFIQALRMFLRMNNLQDFQQIQGQVLTAAQLGSAVVSATTDPFFMSITAAFNWNGKLVVYLAEF